MSQNKENYVLLQTKVSPQQAELLDAICNVLGVNTYQIFQMFFYTLCKASAPMHELSPEIRKLMTLMETDAAWSEAFNMANPEKLRVAQVVLILEQPGKKGFGAVMIDRPFMSEARMTECGDDILERVCEVTMSGIYRRLRVMGADMECNNLSDILLTMLDVQDLLNAEERDAAEGPQMGDIAQNGKVLAYGKRTKRKKHFTPDTMPVTGNLFEDIDHEAPAEPLKDLEGEQHDK
jgi:hypothetical protein